MRRQYDVLSPRQVVHVGVPPLVLLVLVLLQQQELVAGRQGQLLVPAIRVPSLLVGSAKKAVGVSVAASL